LWLAAVLMLAAVAWTASAEDDPAAQRQARRAALLKEIRDLQVALVKAKAAARLQSPQARALDNEIRDIQARIEKIAKADPKVAAARKTAADHEKQRAELQKSIKAAAPIQAKLDALKPPGERPTPEQMKAYNAQRSKLYGELRKVYQANVEWMKLQGRINEARVALRKAVAADDSIAGLQDKMDQQREQLKTAKDEDKRDIYRHMADIREQISRACAANPKVAAAQKTIADLEKQRTDLQKGIEAAKPIQAKLDALKRPGRQGTVEQMEAYVKQRRALYADLRKVYQADPKWMELQGRINAARRAAFQAMAANEQIKALRGEIAAVRKKQDALLAEVPAVREAAAKLAAKQAELKAL
jgi:predicted  nucleic acid-binding Zn-ribbon protein